MGSASTLIGFFSPPERFLSNYFPGKALKSVEFGQDLFFFFLVQRNWKGWLSIDSSFVLLFSKILPPYAVTLAPFRPFFFQPDIDATFFFLLSPQGFK